MPAGKQSQREASYLTLVPLSWAGTDSRWAWCALVNLIQPPGSEYPLMTPALRLQPCSVPGTMDVWYSCLFSSSTWRSNRHFRVMRKAELVTTPHLSLPLLQSLYLRNAAAFSQLLSTWLTANAGAPQEALCKPHATAPFLTSFSLIFDTQPAPGTLQHQSLDTGCLPPTPTLPRGFFSSLVVLWLTFLRS